MFVKLIESPGRVVAQPSMTKFQGRHPIQLRDWQAHWDHWGHEILGNILKRNTWKFGAWENLCFMFWAVEKHIKIYHLDTCGDWHFETGLAWSFEPTENIWTPNKFWIPPEQLVSRQERERLCQGILEALSGNGWYQSRPGNWWPHFLHKTW